MKNFDTKLDFVSYIFLIGIGNFLFFEACIKTGIERGLNGLKDKMKSGGKPRITAEQLIWLRKLIIEENPTKYNYNTEIWTADNRTKTV